MKETLTVVEPLNALTAIRAFGAYNDSLVVLYHDVSRNRKADKISQHFNAELVTKELRRTIPVKNLREAGSFFTGDELSEKALGLFAESVTETSIVIDPACGAGNLLIACAKKLPTRRLLRDTLHVWGRVLHGYDLFAEFVDATKLRLILEAISRGSDPNGESLEDLKNLMPGIRQGNGLTSHLPAGCTHVIINPPFRMVPAPFDCVWAKGRLNESAIFIQSCWERIQSRCQIVAILPEVLRCGSRYHKWRLMAERQLEVQVEPAGQFDSKTDVDIFLLFGRFLTESTPKVISKIDWQVCEKSNIMQAVGDIFEITVGSVVPHRDDISGSSSPYAIARNLPKWQTIKDLSSRCGYKGHKVKPPFVLIRRTSSPSDKERAVATIINGKEQVSVENHLIVAKPRIGGLRACRELLAILKDPGTNDFLNQRIRCRHLTVSAVKEIPWTGDPV